MQAQPGVGYTPYAGRPDPWQMMVNDGVAGLGYQPHQNAENTLRWASLGRAFDESIVGAERKTKYWAAFIARFGAPYGTDAPLGAENEVNTWPRCFDALYPTGYFGDMAAYDGQYIEREVIDASWRADKNMTHAAAIVLGMDGCDANHPIHFSDPNQPPGLGHRPGSGVWMAIEYTYNDAVHALPPIDPTPIIPPPEPTAPHRVELSDRDLKTIKLAPHFISLDLHRGVIIPLFQRMANAVAIETN